MRIFAKLLSAVAVALFGAMFLSGAQIAAAGMYYPDPKTVPPPPPEKGVIDLLKSAPVVNALPSGPSCFDYYHFQSVQVSVGTNRDKYAAGEKVMFSGELNNKNDYPVVDGYVFVRISRERANFTIEGNDVIDETIPIEKVALDTKQSKQVAFNWTIPNDLPAGHYRADYFFSVGKKFNLGGLPFSNDVIVGFAKFEIGGKTNEGVFFDRAATKVNGTAYKHIGNWPNVPAGSKVAISQPLKNTSDKDAEVKIRYDLYFWDSLNEADKLDSRTETATIPAKGSKELIYEIPAVKEPVYYLKITALTGDRKSVVNIRVASDLERPRLNYPGVTKFPLAKGDAYMLFSCFHDASSLDSSGKMFLTLSDKSGNEVGKMEYVGPITSMMMADKKDLIADKGYDYLKLSATLSDKNGKTVDSYETVYDCNAIDPAKCEKPSYIIYYLGGLLFLILIAGFSLVFRKKIPPPAAMLFFILIAGYGINAAPAEAYNQKSATSASDFSHWMYGSGVGRIISSGNVSLTHLIDMTAGNYSVKINDPINFAYSNSCSFNASGGNWDTPWCGADKNNATWLNITTSGGAGFISWSFTDPVVSMTSSDPSVISCSGMNCTAKAAGTAMLTANIAATEAKVWTIVKMKDAANNQRWFFDYLPGDNGISFCLTDGVPNNVSDPYNYVNLNGNYAYPGSWCSGWGSAMAVSPTKLEFTRLLSLPADSSMSWTVTVAAPLAANISASPNPIDYGGSSAISWNCTGPVNETISGSILDTTTGTIFYGTPNAGAGDKSTSSLYASHTYVLTCTGVGGDKATASVTVYVKPPTHTACSSGACVVQTGFASNTCASILDCGGGGGGGGGGGSQHLDCANNACVWVSGTGYDKCASNTDCGGAEHSACVNKACVIVPGAGTNACRKDVDCGGASGPTYGVCANNACTQVAGTPPSNAFTCGVDADCASGPSYTLRSSNNLSITILQSDAVYCSNKTTLTVLPYRDFSGDIKLAIADLGGFAMATTSAGNFSINPLTITDYDTGSQFSVCAKAGASAGPYKLKVQGTGGNSVIIKLNVVKKAPSFQETSLWRLLAGIHGLF